MTVRVVLLAKGLMTKQQTLYDRLAFKCALPLLILVVMVGLMFVDSLAGDWTTFQYNVLHTGYNDSDSISLPLWTRWFREIHTNFRSLDQITVVGDDAFVSTGSFLLPYAIDPGVRCLDAHTGTLKWEYTCKAFIDCDNVTQVTFGYGNVYFQKSNGTGSKLLAINAETGVEDFAAGYVTQVDDFYAPALADSIVVTGGGFFGGLYGWDALSGGILWFESAAPDDHYTPAIFHDTVYVWIAGWIIARDLWTGELLWQIQKPAASRDTERGGSVMASAVVVDTTQRILYTIWDDNFHALDINTRTWLWHKCGAYYYQQRGINPVLVGDQIIIVDSGTVIAYQGRTGEELWRVQSDYVDIDSGEHEPIAFCMAAANGLLFASTSQHTIAIDLQSHQIVWHGFFPGRLSIANGWLYVATVDGWVYAYGPPPTDANEEPATNLPSNFVLQQNYPNPLNPTTRITFSLPRRTDIKLEIFDPTGRLVETLTEGSYPAGEYSIEWNGKDHASGVYLYRLIAGDRVESKKMVLVK